MLGSLSAQVINPADTIPISLEEKRFNEQYNRNIKKSRINGVYIPKNLSEAFDELKALSSEESLNKFKSVEADLVISRLHYGLGRWMIMNWNFYDGSRLSHNIKEYGVTHPDDMARFILFTFHNHLNGIDIDEAGIAKKIIAERMKELDRRKTDG